MDLKNTIIMFALLFAPTLTSKPRSVNLALETSIQFDRNDGIKSFIKNLQSVLAQNEPTFRQKSDDNLLTKFLTEIGSELINFDDDRIKLFAQALNAVVFDKTNREDFNDIVKDKRLKNIIRNSVSDWTQTDPVKLKLAIAKYVTNKNMTSLVTFFRNLDKLFDDTDEGKFRSLSKTFNEANTTRDYVRFLSKTINFVIFKRYEKLSTFLKVVCLHELAKLTEYLSEHYSYLTKEKEAGVEDRRLFVFHRAVSMRDTSSSSEELIREKKEEKMNNEIVIKKDFEVNVHKMR